jgi:anti-sigma factor RsiW
VSGHLGPLAAALVDDQLTGSVRNRALRHIADCEGCRFEVAQQRAMKVRLDGLGEPALPSSLLDRLQSMRPLDAGLSSGPPAGAPLVPPTPPAPARPTAGTRHGTVPSDVSGQLPGPGPLGLGSQARPWTLFHGPVGRQRVRRVLVGATSVVLLGGGAAYAAGGQDASPIPVRPAVDAYTVQHETTSGNMPLHDPAITTVTAGFGR